MFQSCISGSFVSAMCKIVHVVSLQGTDAATLQDIVNFMYTGSITINKKNVWEICVTAVMLQVRFFSLSVFNFPVGQRRICGSSFDSMTSVSVEFAKVQDCCSLCLRFTTVFLKRKNSYKTDG